MQLKVENSPFNQEQVDLLNRLLPKFTEEQKMWLCGYLTALNQTAALTKAQPVLQNNPSISVSTEISTAACLEITVLFGSQTGNARRLAEKLTEKLKEHGFQITCSAMDDFKPQKLKNVRILLIVVSTYGEGDPPDNALSFYEFLHSRKAPCLKELQYSVLALGDSSYEHFCKTGQDFDKRLKELGGEQLYPRTDCDVDFEDPAQEWMEGILRTLHEMPESASAITAATVSAGSPAPGPSPALLASGTPPVTDQPVYSRSHPFEAEVLDNLNLNGRGSDRETRHLELSIEGSNLQYEPGDCLGIYPQNQPMLVDTLINVMGWHPEELVPVGKERGECPLREALLRHYEITVLTKTVLEQVAQLSANPGLKELLKQGNEKAFRAYVEGRDLLDLVEDYALSGIPARDFVPMLRMIPPRLYSIASSPKASPEEVHLTIRAVRYHAHGRQRFGVCSVYCAERVQPGDTLPVYVHHNPDFKLPSNPDTPVIMIGPGTGVAPFRGFLAEREEIGAKGKTWLFFGDRHFRTDFLYQLEWQRWLKEGVLTRMDVAFSRDTDSKVYVQHRMQEKSRELFEWLEEGAHVYVCGDKQRMAKDVHAALIDILEGEGGMSREESEAYLTRMRQEKRYQRDVY
ncbi:sulfite reductase (NADPH) flavoprotein alpha-component [Caldalkalibacillus uzonensis]|uniref:Sulfite reductase (NADPH) flavoprotein alpha-component n=1 Tax=Caldalkalibacillus uzonensis TaxID=353224 RepID=A0ABU0CLX8_9BACI|nr:assimilatory sulfite reductase (NADPH) flavoprotein subunit [Caldalkalibacillus uzonensis]MDQ0337417.1 sulfite reductase (NADPH) flavoprotein alpha-component [Caldalkalibacillus uzonensis]